MAFVSGKTYRFTNKYFETHALNVYGTNAASTGRNVCLFTDDPIDRMQDWVVKASGSYFRMHSAISNSFVLDCSDGSLPNSYKNNAHLCATNETSLADSQVEFKKVSDNVYKIYLPAKKLYLTATNTTLKSGEPAASISTATALSGGTGRHSNVYWAPASTSTKQQWIVFPAVDGGSTPDPNPPKNFPTKQYLIPPFPYTGVTADFGTDCEQIAAAQEAGKTVCSLYPYTFHYGTDLIGKDKNSEDVFVGIRNIRSSGYGEVVSVRNPDNPEKVALGRTVLVKYPNAAYGSGASKRDIYFLYCHLESIAVSSGQKVFPGDLIGVEGNSGYGAVAIHLHLEAYTSKITTSATEGGSISAVDSAIYFFNKTQEDDSYGYGRSTIVPDCDSPFGAAAYCDGTPTKCTHNNKLYFYNMAKIRGRGNFRNPTF